MQKMSPDRFKRGKRMIETSGHISKRDQLNVIMSQGRNLLEYRQKNYPELANDGDPDKLIYIPSSRKDYDFFDAHEDMLKMTKKAADAKRYCDRLRAKAMEEQKDQQIADLVEQSMKERQSQSN